MIHGITGTREYSGNVKLKKNCQGVIVSVTLYDQPSLNDQTHYHTNPHFGFTVQGGCIERKQDRYELAPGDISYYMAGEKHQVVRVAKPSIRVNLEIEPPFIDAYQLTDTIIHKTATKDLATKFLMVAIYHELLTNQECSSLNIHQLVLALFHQSKKIANEKSIPAWVPIVCDYLRAHGHEPLTLTDLARVAGVHPVTLSKYFARYVGCNLGHYIRQIRVEKSIGLIKATNASMGSISYQCGFFDQSHFNRSFKEVNGILPGRYKKLEPR
ncbi:helix-turn-helix domain-containing protein [Spirosoma sp. HMF4905]|uniref:Helix-turn-helix domain-containing protein n=1 Tax=Spirosoma arboris TaxID=2682092 RepID=A0A7K1SPC1_9BACT|nr:AraC family transcriptional regulator [Spirosoma arboris]MVM35662.1 helix-turn-helix domain-containing protein [Spirosoma arboris]